MPGQKADAMKLRKLARLCEHDQITSHPYRPDVSSSDVWECPGGVFLPDDTLIIEKVDGEWPEWVRRVTWQWDKREHVDGSDFLDALFIREAE